MRGVWTALVTPFTSTDELDLPAFRKILRDQREAGVTGVIPCGTTGESPTLSSDEKKTLIRAALDELKGSNVKVIAGTGSNDTRETVALSKWASDAGVDGLLVVTPYYNKPTQAGLEAHFRAVADAAKCELMLYNVPGRAGVALTPETIVRLANHPRIRSIKEATGSVAFMSEVIDALRSAGISMDVLSGDDVTFLPALSVGAVGVVSVSSNLFPRAMCGIQKEHDAGHLSGARELHLRFYPLFRDLFIESNPGPVKAAMARAGFCDERMRLPMVPLADTSRRKLEASLKACGIEQGKSF